MDYRIAIVDDEPNLVEALYDLLRQRLEDTVELLRAYSATEFCSLILHTPVDIVVSDILMPGITGIDMLDRIELLCPGCRVIFLTGFENFAWIQQAIRHPCCVDYLLKTAGFDATVRAVQKQLSILKQADTPEVLLQRMLVSQDARHRETVNRAAQSWLSGRGECADACLSCSPQCGIHVFLCRRTSLGSLGGLFSKVLRRQFEEQFSTFSALDIVVCGWEEYVCLVQYGPNPGLPQEERLLIRARMERIQEVLEAFDERIDMAYQTGMCPLADAPGVLERLRKEMEKSCASQSGVILDCSAHADAMSADHALTEKVGAYILDHIADHNLSVATIASATYYSSAHLNRLFKKETGKNVSDYIAELRIKTACRYLKESMLEIQEIGRRIGFESPSYFGLFFKRNVGVTPSEYRRGKEG